MPTSDGGDVFDCPDCGASASVSDAVRDALVSHGCVVCGAAVTAGAFAEPTVPDPRSPGS